MASTTEIKTTLCRLSYARDLFTARLVDEKKPDGKKKYGCTLIFLKSDTAGRAALEGLALDAIKAEWGERGVENLKKKIIKTPFFDGDGAEARYKLGERAGELHPGMGSDVWFIRVSANYADYDEQGKVKKILKPPRVWWTDKEVQVTEDEAYSGCYGKAIVNAFTSNHPTGGLRVSFGILGFQKLKEGERLSTGGAINVDKWNETITDEGPAPNVGGGGAASLFGD